MIKNVQFLNLKTILFVFYTFFDIHKLIIVLDLREKFK